MPSTLYGRYGAYNPRNDRERAKARLQASKRRVQAATLAAWLKKHEACANGCGRPVAVYDEINYALRFSGCCSADCEAALQGRERNA